MTFSKIIKVTNKYGKLHKVCVTYIDGVMTAESWQLVQKIKSGLL